MKKFILLSIVLCTAAAAGAKEPAEAFAACLAKHGREPMTYIAEKLRTYTVVALGEDHWVKDHPQFLCEVIRSVARDSTARPDVIALEFGNRLDQRLADTVSAADIYREDLVKRILQQAPDTYGNPYREYADVFRTIWEVNRTLPRGDRMRIVLLDPPYVQAWMDGEAFTRTGSRDDAMFDAIRRSIVARERVLFYAGMAHTQAQVRGSRLVEEDYYFNYLSAGKLLKTAYPAEVFIINLWGPLMGANGYIPTGDTTRWVRIAGGTIDEAFRLNGDRPVALDIDRPPFDELTAADYFQRPNGMPWPAAAEKGTPFTRDKKLCGQVDGIVFIKPVAQFSGITLYDIYDDRFLERAAAREQGACRTREEIFDRLRELHPILQPVPDTGDDDRSPRPAR